jgi:murein L,D-transpeptidase YcbB/YkuD
LTKDGYEDGGNTPDPPKTTQNLNKATDELKTLLNSHKQQTIQTYLESLSPNEASNYSLWKATKRLQRPQTPIPPLRTPGVWVKSGVHKANTLADHFEQAFQPHVPDQTGGATRDTLLSLETDKLLASPTKNFTATE